MKSSKSFKDEQVENGRAIARGMSQFKVQAEKNMAKAEKRKQTMLENAAEKAIGGGIGLGA